MGFINIQIIIILSIILFGIIGGKKGAFIATLVWGIETIFVYKLSSINYLQIIAIAFSFQISLILGVARDAIIKLIKKKKEAKVKELNS